MPSVQPSALIDSPCVRNCCLDDDDICLGCGRSLQEITRWSTSNDVTKEAILSSAAERRVRRRTLDDKPDNQI